MRRILLPVALGIVTLSFSALPVSADFHGACTGFATGYANVGLSAHDDGYYGTELEFSGIVSCPDAAIGIDALELVDLGTGLVIASLSPSVACAPDLAPCEGADSAPAGSGSYEVRMTFSVDNPETDGVDYPAVERYARFAYLGAGQPVPVCTSIGSFPVYVGC